MCEVCGLLMMFEKGSRHYKIEDCLGGQREELLQLRAEIDELSDELEMLKQGKESQGV